jgi:hypothetical protein
MAKIFINALLKCMYSPVLTRTFEYLRALSTVLLRIYRSIYIYMCYVLVLANNFYFIIFVWCLGNVLPVTENLNGAVYRHIQGQLSRKYRILIIKQGHIWRIWWKWYLWMIKFRQKTYWTTVTTWMYIILLLIYFVSQELAELQSA